MIPNYSSRVVLQKLSSIYLGATVQDYKIQDSVVLIGETGSSFLTCLTKRFVNSANCHSGFKKTPSPTVVVGDNTNPLIGMLPCQIHKLYLRPEPKQGENHPPKCWSSALLRITVGPEVYRNVSFMHHIVGWYTTPGVGIGRKALVRRLVI